MAPHPWLVPLLGALVCCCGAVQTREKSGAAKPNIVVIISDDMRPALGMYDTGSDVVHTPNLDTLASDPTSVVFDNAFVQQAGVCSGSNHIKTRVPT